MRVAALAVAHLGQSPAFSSLYLSRPQGGPMQPDYWNAVVGISTVWTPLTLLHLLMQIERRFGRSRRERWGPRTLDLDLLVYGEVTMDTPELVLPHPRLTTRRFVLEPLQELFPDFLFTGGDHIGAMLDEVSTQEVHRLCPLSDSLGV